MSYISNKYNVQVKRIYCTKCKNYRKFKKSKISYIFNKTIVLSFFCDNCGNNDNKTLQEE